MASGKLKYDLKTNAAEGRYDDLHHSIQMAMEPNFADTAEQQKLIGSNSPSHTVYIAAPNGRLSQAGSAWVKRLERGATQGALFFSIQIDDPSFTQTLNLSAFPVQDRDGKAVPGEYDVVWRRARQVAA